MSVICACATPWGHGAVALVRVSGAGTAAVLRSVCGRLPAGRRASLCALSDERGVFDEGIVVWMPGPSSYTGEDSAEISCHGNPLLVERLLAALCAAGARLAGPGEFTRRALLSGRIDLIRAESVLQTIEATSEAGLALARSQMAGALFDETERLRCALVEIAAELEVELDYPGELLGSSTCLEALATLVNQADALLATYAYGRVAIEGARVVLVGEVNAGKSSLFNALLGRSRALVSATPGTTRDVVEATLQLPELRVILCDTAGARETDDAIERDGQASAEQASAEADLLLVIINGAEASGAYVLERTAGRPRIVVYTHADLRVAPRPDEGLWVSSVEGTGIAELRAEIVRQLRVEEPGAVRTIVATQRQHACLLAFRDGVAGAIGSAGAGPAVVVEHLYDGLRALDSLSGRDTREDVLDRLFARFCIGK